jgi:hypothetical protein
MPCGMERAPAFVLDEPDFLATSAMPSILQDGQPTLAHSGVKHAIACAAS